MHFNNAAHRHSARRRKNKRTRLIIFSVLALILAALLIAYGIRSAANSSDTETTTTETVETTTQEQPADDETITQDPTDTESDEASDTQETTETEPEDASDPEETTEEATEETTATDETAAQAPPSDESPVIALTFDDGPAVDGEDQLTERLLDILAEENVSATFFVLGSQIDAGREATLLRTYQEGHEVANHSYSHVIFTETDEQRIRDELTRTNELIENITGQRPRLMRPPTGAYNTLVKDISRELDLAIVNWSWQSTPQDWNYHDNPEPILEHVLEHAANGHIVLLHDTNRATLEIMPSMIAGLKEKGFRFMTVSELLSYLDDDHPEAGAVYTHFAPPIE